MPSADGFLGMGPQQAIDNLDNPDFIYDACNDSEVVDVLNIDFNRLAIKPIFCPSALVNTRLLPSGLAAIISATVPPRV